MFQVFTAQILRFVVLWVWTPCSFVGELSFRRNVLCPPELRIWSRVTVFSVVLRSRVTVFSVELRTRVTVFSVELRPDLAAPS